MTKLCPRGKAAAKRKFAVYPSAYANAYASKICAGKIKDPSGVKRKDFKGPKPSGAKKGKMIIMIAIGKKKKVDKKMAGGMTAGSMSGMGRLQKARMMNKGGGFDAGTPGKVRDILNKQVRVGNKIVGERVTKKDMDKLKKVGVPKIQKIVQSKKYNKGGGADTGRRGELKSKLGVAINKIKRNRPTRPDIKKIKQKFQSEKDLPRAMRIDTTTSAYGDAGKGRPVPKYQTGGPSGSLPRTRPGQSPRGVKPRDSRYRAEPYRRPTPKINFKKRKKAFKIGGLVDYYKDLM
jgi:hypothetical protein